MMYFFHFGFASQLSKLELSSVLSRNKIKYKNTSISKNFQVISTKSKLDILKIQKILAGTTRIGVQVFKTQNTNQLNSLITNYLDQKENKNYTITQITHILDLQKTHQFIKNNSKTPKRYLIPDKTFCSPLTLQKQKVIEIILIEINRQIHVFETLSTSNVLDWQYRDQNRPGLDPSSGMLPPKVARMMVNIALSQPKPSPPYLIDPFCGSGTILVEAILVGAKIFGSDISVSAIQNSQKNINWLNHNYSTTKKLDHQLKKISAQKLDPSMFKTRFDAIVTETDLGPPVRLTDEKMVIIYQNLFHRYQQIFSHLIHILKPNSKFVAALPIFPHKNSQKMLNELIDTCEKSGYTLSVKPTTYSKPHARIKRAIIVINKKNTKNSHKISKISN